ncbi:MAG: tRNA 2-thiouridine(34) synthase MnmA [Pirellulaceae bacterium]|nr:tRNA 2-thiouridine(34) synthase MnmA [Pirellulaceae bacterium]
MSRVVLAMSGGVDSSVAAHLLREQGHEVVGVFMRHGTESPVACSTHSPANEQLSILNQRLDHKQGCCSATDAHDARRVADRLEIPFYALNLNQEFGRIMDYFVDEYSAGRTPNPCVMCNHWIKFGKLFDYADSIGAEFVATGHYARLVTESNHGTTTICRGVDHAKDQSYVLFGIARSLLSRMLLPVGSYTKPQIRELATELSLGVADKRDSQEICFVVTGKHDEFIRERRGHSDMSGEIVTTDGTLVGTHPGIEGFTVGQRKGLGVAMGEPHFVIRIEAESRRVVIGTRNELARRELTAKNSNWLIEPPDCSFPCLAQIRYNSKAEPATVHLVDNNSFQVEFDSAQHGVAPGQAVVCYQNDHVLGGGWIE